ncbi:DoxX family membrane protein [Tellurirhabdus rosea]|uniref:DoxX family membrane protein n=1 Tax=Tellurirhabdus rosea TaxID=2674997 RepID=UPI00225C3508|nr:DoxX family membrane protein [Tellurirhabdus rosea]
MNRASYLLLRLTVALSMFGHGLVRLPKLDKFSAGMVKNFEKSMLPEVLVTPFSYALPFAELLCGVLLLLGLFTRLGLYLGGAIMLTLVLGSCLIEQWDALPSQMIHVAFFAVLLHFLPSNSFALDNARGRRDH